MLFLLKLTLNLKYNGTQSVIYVFELSLDSLQGINLFFI